jgi:hypothetical protein
MVFACPETTMTRPLLACCFVLVTACGVGEPLTPAESGLTSTPATPTTPETPPTTSSSACWDGVTLPRPAVDPTPTASVAAAFEAWQAAVGKYQADATAYDAIAQAHAEAYGAAASGVVGLACSQNADCDTHSSAFPGTCNIYYRIGQCAVSDPNPPLGPTPPPQPRFTCADFTCPQTGYQCEQEVETTGIACVLSRCSGHGGGGSGGRH